jgi:hypothetical protein
MYILDNRSPSAVRGKVFLALSLVFAVTDALVPGAIWAADGQQAVVVAPAKASGLVTKTGPFSSGKGEIPIHIQEITGKVDANNVEVIVEPLLTNKSQALELKSAVATLPAGPLKITKGSALTVRVIIEPVEAGTATARVTFRGPSLQAPVSTTLEVSVRDPWWAALIPIFIGTVLSYWAYRWRSSRRNLLVLRIRATRLQQEANSLERRRPDLRVQLQQVYRLIRDALLEIEVESEQQANTFLTNARQTLDQLSATQPPAAAAIAAAAVQVNWFWRAWGRLIAVVRRYFSFLISPRTEEELLRSLRIKTAFRGTVVVLVVTLLGLLVVYDDKAFGGWDYITAILYGFGLDQGLKGLSQITDKI